MKLVDRQQFTELEMMYRAFLRDATQHAPDFATRFRAEAALNAIEKPDPTQEKWREQMLANPERFNDRVIAIGHGLNLAGEWVEQMETPLQSWVLLMDYLHSEIGLSVADRRIDIAGCSQSVWSFWPATQIRAGELKAILDAEKRGLLSGQHNLLATARITAVETVHGVEVGRALLAGKSRDAAIAGAIKAVLAPLEGTLPSHLAFRSKADLPKPAKTGAPA